MILEQIEKLTQVIRLEPEIIDEMFVLLLQHVSTEDEGLIKIMEKMRDVEELEELDELPFGDK